MTAACANGCGVRVKANGDGGALCAKCRAEQARLEARERERRVRVAVRALVRQGVVPKRLLREVST